MSKKKTKPQGPTPKVKGEGKIIVCSLDEIKQLIAFERRLNRQAAAGDEDDITFNDTLKEYEDEVAAYGPITNDDIVEYLKKSITPIK